MESLKVVWHDPNIFNEENTRYVSRYLSGIDNRLFETVEEAAKFLANSQNKWILVTSGRNGKELVQKVHDYSCIVEILVFCGNPNLHQQWATAFPKIKSLISSCFADVVKRAVRDWNQIESSVGIKIKPPELAVSIKIDPALKLAFSSINQLDINFYWLLKPNLQNQEIKREDLLNEFQALSPQQNDFQQISSIFEKNQDNLLKATVLGYMQSPFFEHINDCLYRNYYHRISNITNGCLYFLKLKPELMTQQACILYREAYIPPSSLLNYSQGQTGYWSSFSFASLKRYEGHLGNALFEIHFPQYLPHPHIHLKSLIPDYENANEILLLPYFPFIILSIEEKKKYTKIIVRQDESRPSLSINNDLINEYWKNWVWAEIQEPFTKICKKLREEDIQSINLPKYFMSNSNDGESPFLKDFKIIVHRCYHKNKEAIFDNFKNDSSSWINSPLVIYWNTMRNDIRNSLIFSMKSWFEKPLKIFDDFNQKNTGKVINYEAIPKISVPITILTSLVSLIFCYAETQDYSGPVEIPAGVPLESKVLEDLKRIIDVFGKDIRSGAVAYGADVVNTADQIKNELHAQLNSLQQNVNYAIENFLAY
ncbi:unnamed protein product [Blepharisma stoltei]|uniref:Uncharacterized protein n=1 Tax=Blepharisma stoltei TaxID=1481888 RepID=A0AAU9IRT8_9CILI|nr:unnamed protein product [Blepharisma stoltei]